MIEIAETQVLQIVELIENNQAILPAFLINQRSQLQQLSEKRLFSSLWYSLGNWLTAIHEAW